MMLADRSVVDKVVAIVFPISPFVAGGRRAAAHHALIGSVALKVAAHAAVPVMLVK